jgi:hypothetical protein
VNLKRGVLDVRLTSWETIHLSIDESLLAEVQAGYERFADDTI